MNRIYTFFATATMLVCPCCVAQSVSASPGTSQPTILYGAAYYNEYMPYERLDKDVALMKEAGIRSCAWASPPGVCGSRRMAHFEYAWMDRVVDAMGKAGIKVIMGTPTYSIPTWMYHAHPEILARPLGGAQTFYGMRQNMDTDNPKYRFYAERLIRNLVSTTKQSRGDRLADRQRDGLLWRLER